MPVIHTSDKEKKRKLMRSIIGAAQARCPWMLKEWADALKEVRRSEFSKSGKLRAEARGETDHAGYIRVRFPRELFFLMRRFWPKFGNDDKDLRLLAEEFPDLVEHKGAKHVHK